jgi:protein-tyrosine phosphatase
MLDLDLEGCENIRDLGGVAAASGQTAFAVFLRGDNARRLTVSGWRQAAAYGVRTVLDLRSEPECVVDPPAAEGFLHTRLSLFDHYDSNDAYRADFHARVAELSVAEQHRALYNEALDLDRERFAEAVGVLAHADGCVLFHCVGGKDRTGVLAALLLRLVGVSMEAIEGDYIRTEERLDKVTAPHIDGTAPAQVITQVISDLEAQYGTIAGYLLAAGASVAELETIVRKFAHGESASDFPSAVA